MALADELQWRGFVGQTTFETVEGVNEPRTLYWGIDPSADSMQIGNLAAAMLVRQFVEHGHRLVVLVGGATGLIGDPDGKKQERDTKSPKEIQHNVDKLRTQLEKIFSDVSYEIVDNQDWFRHMNYLDFLRDVGKHVSMTQLLDREFIQSRIGEGGAGISYAEFSYALIQGYDFLHLHREHGVSLQLSGADQWGNSIAGVQLIRRIAGKEAHIFTTPLIVNKQTGIKFGKSEDGAVWLDAEKTSPYKFYQFWLNVDDEMAQDLIKIYTTLDRETIGAFIENHSANPGARVLQKKLAEEVTRFVHGEARMQSVRNVTSVLFGEKTVDSLISDELDDLAQEIPSVSRGISVVDALVQSGVCGSNSEARRLIAGNAIAINGDKIKEDAELTDITLIKKGKNQFVLVK